jgi:hypothetical protein
MIQVGLREPITVDDLAANAGSPQDQLQHVDQGLAIGITQCLRAFYPPSKMR